MAVLVEERDREKKGCQQVPPWWLGWKKVPGANLGSGLVLLGSETGTGLASDSVICPGRPGWTRGWSVHLHGHVNGLGIFDDGCDVDVELETDKANSERQDAFF